ncbi:type I-E CRISPR-associated protein Cas7/Cse4/CasC [Escherichia coli]
MTTFIQLHLLTAYPAANLNRDDTGAPKTVVLGGATRLRVSSQSLKRAWRTSALFEQALAGHIGIRSGRIAREAATILIEKGIEEKKAIEWAAKIADYLGKAKNDKKPKDPLTNAETEQLVHISPAEFDAVKVLAHQLAEEKRAPKEEDLALLRKDRMAVDIAMFGRMLANKPEFNVEAACQVAHAFGVSETIVEDDFFTAVDDLRQASEDAGARHLGEGNASDVLRNVYQQYQDRFRELKVSLPKLQDECWWEGEHDGLVASKILRRRDVPLNRQQWLFGERTINQGPWLSKEEPCTSQE